MEKDLEKTSRNRSISGGESNNNEELVSMDVEEESEASTASSLNQQQQQQQQRKLWRSKSTVRSQESSLEAATAVTNDELKELKQWFQVQNIIKYVTSVQFLCNIFCLKKKAFRPSWKGIIYYFSPFSSPSPVECWTRPGAKRKRVQTVQMTFWVGGGVHKRNSNLSLDAEFVCVRGGRTISRRRAIWMMRNRLRNCLSTTPQHKQVCPLRHFHGSFDVSQKKKI